MSDDGLDTFEVTLNWDSLSALLGVLGAGRKPWFTRDGAFGLLEKNGVLRATFRREHDGRTLWRNLGVEDVERLRAQVSHALSKRPSGPYSVCETEEGWVLQDAGAGVQTPAGQPVAHRSRRLVEHVRRELAVSASRVVEVLSAFSMLCTQVDFVDQGIDVIRDQFEHALLHDPLLYLSPGSERALQLRSWLPIRSYLDGIGAPMPALSGPVGCHGEPHDPEAFAVFVGVIQRSYLKLDSIRRNAVINLFQTGAGVLLPLALVTGHCSALEYAEALTVTTFGASEQDDGSRMRAAREEATIVLDYIQHAWEPELQWVMKLIQTGESGQVEFKETLRKNVHTGKNDVRMEDSVLKTLAAFMNTEGGTLLIGVHDNGTIMGIEPDNFKNLDKFQLHFINLVKDRLGGEVTPYLDFRTVSTPSGTVFRVDARYAGSTPIFFRMKGAETYMVRLGASSQDLPLSKAHEHIELRKRQLKNS